MSETRSTDMGTYVVVEVGEPTLADPSVYYSRDVQYKAGTVQANRVTLGQRAATALTNNTTYLATPATNLTGAIAQIAALTRQNNALIRLVLEMTDSLGGT